MEKKEVLKAGRKAGIWLLVAAVAVLACLMTVRCMELEKELKTAQEATENAEKTHGDEALEDKLDEIYMAEDTEKEDRKALANLMRNFVQACYRAPSSDYAQAPYLTDFMTDQGIRDYLKTVNPAVWGDVDIKIAEDVRAAYDPAAQWRESRVTISGTKIYTELTEDGGAHVLWYADIKPDGAQYNTMSFILEAVCVKEGDTWRINSLDTMQQII